MLDKFLLLLIILSWIYWLVACGMVYSFYRRKDETDPAFTPPVSILKPIKGVDDQAYDNYASFCTQDYPDFEILFGVSNKSDPVILVLEKLQRDFPDVKIKILSSPPVGTNRKVSILIRLAEQADNEILVISDSDVRVTPTYLQKVVAPLKDDGVGLVTCTYKGEDAETVFAGLEALHMGVTFRPSVIVARLFLDMRFALGATMALRKSDLDRIGGFQTIVNFLADDYQLGARIADLGLKVVLSDYIVTIMIGPTTLQEQWRREIRWTRCNRVNRPKEYPGLLLSFSTPLSLAYLLVTDFEPLAWTILSASIFLRWLVAWLVTGFTNDHGLRTWLLWLPVRDVLSAVIWLFGLLGRRIYWRGEEFILKPDGQMEETISSEVYRHID